MPKKQNINQLQIRLVTSSSTVTTTLLSRILKDTVTVLNRLARNLEAPREARRDWRIVRASMNSPLLMDVVPPIDVEQPIANTLIEGISFLSTHTTLPDRFDLEAVNGLTVIGKNLHQKDRLTIEYKTETGKAELTPEVSARALRLRDQLSIVEGVRYEPYDTNACLEGYLHNIETHDRFGFRLYNGLSDYPTKCEIEDEVLLQTATECLRKKVFVSGCVHYGETGKPESIRVASINPFPKDLLDITSLPPIDLTNGVDPAHFIEASRYA